MTGRGLIAVAALALCATVAQHAGAQGVYPARPIRYIVAYPPGGANDILARTLAQRLSDTWNQPVLVENRAGASGNIGAEFAAKATPDGYTLFSISSNHAINASLYAKLGYNIAKDFAPISMIATTPLILTVHPSVQANSVAELVALAKNKPLAYGSSGSGTASHLAGEMFMAAAGISLTHVPYKGGAQATADLLGGQLSMMFNNLAEAIAYVKADKLHALAVTARSRSEFAPDVPTMAEAGYPGVEAATCIGIVAPAGTPRDILARLNLEIVRILQLHDVRARLSEQGFQVSPTRPEEFGDYLRSEVARWARVVKASGAKAD